MKSFWYGNNALSNDEDTYGSAGLVNISGQDWLGIGQTISSLSQGTPLCGSKPVCMSFSKDSDCAKRKQAFDQCVQQNIQVEQTKSLEKLENQKRITKIAVISLVSVAVIALIFVMVRRKKAN